MSFHRARRFQAFMDRWGKTMDGVFTLAIALAITGGLAGLWPMKWAVWTLLGGLVVLGAGMALAYLWARRSDRP